MMQQKHIWLAAGLIMLTLTSCHVRSTDTPDILTNTDEIEEIKSAIDQAYQNELRLLQYALIFVNARYVEPKRIDWQKMAVYAIDAIQKNVPEVVARFDRHIDDMPNTLMLRVNLAQKQYDIHDIRTLAEVHKLCTDAFQFVFQNLIEPQDQKEIEYAMINGMFSTLDPHTNLMPPWMFEDMMTGNGGFAGCGFVVGVRGDNQLTVISPMEGAPAWKAGIRAGDAVVRIDDESTENMPLQDAVDRMRGDPDTQVTLYVMRKGWTEPKPFVITREIIQVKSVTSKALTKDNVGYLKLKSFDQTTAAEVKKHLEALHQAMPKMKGLVIDLRNNSGGLLLQSIEIAELFLQKGDTIVTVEGPNASERESSNARKTGSERDYPIVVLTNEGTASASEIVSGALQYHDRAVIMGERTFGKGSVQVLKDNADGSAIKITSAQYLTPGDISIQGVGIIPDIGFKPAFVDKETGTSLSANHHVRREDNLEQSLHSEKTVSRESFVELTYLYREPTEEKERAKELGLMTSDLRSTEDYTEDDETRFAIDFIKQLKGTKREEMLKNSSAFFDTYRATYDQNVTKALAEFDVDWTMHHPTANDEVVAPQPDAFSWGFELDGKAVKADEQGRLTLDLAKHGEEQTITMWAKNETPDTYEAVTALLVTNNPYLDEREFVFGKMAPGETRRWDVKLKVPKRAEARDDTVEVDFTAQRMLNAATNQWHKVKSPCVPAKDVTGKDTCTWPRATFDARVLDPKVPTFSWNWWIDDTARGNGDASLSRGESVDFYVWVKNNSDVDSDKVKVALANESGSGILLQNARVTLDPIPAGASRLAHLSFDVSQDKPQKPPSKRIKRSKPFDPDAASLILMIDDSVNAIEISEPINIPISVDAITPLKPQFAPAKLAAGSQLFATHTDKAIAKTISNQIVMTSDINDTTAIVCWPEDGVMPCAFAPKTSLSHEDLDAAAVEKLKADAKTAAENAAKPSLPKFDFDNDKDKDKNKKSAPLPPKPVSPFGPIFTTNAPVVTFEERPHTENAAEVTIYANISDDEMLKSYEAYLWTMNGLQMQVEKLDYALVTTPNKRLAIEVPLKTGDNILGIYAHDNKDIEGIGMFHIQRN